MSWRLPRSSPRAFRQVAHWTRSAWWRMAPCSATGVQLRSHARSPSWSATAHPSSLARCCASTAGCKYGPREPGRTVQTVKALFKVASGPGALEVRETPAPSPRDDEVVIDVAGASICGSDLYIVQWHPMAQWTTTPVILGHEFAGVVREVGSAV